jgi:hypothetical protein
VVGTRSRPRFSFEPGAEIADRGRSRASPFARARSDLLPACWASKAGSRWRPQLTSTAEVQDACEPAIRTFEQTRDLQPPTLPARARIESDSTSTIIYGLNPAPVAARSFRKTIELASSSGPDSSSRAIRTPSSLRSRRKTQKAIPARGTCRHRASEARALWDRVHELFITARRITSRAGWITISPLEDRFASAVAAREHTRFPVTSMGYHDAPRNYPRGTSPSDSRSGSFRHAADLGGRVRSLALERT